MNKEIVLNKIKRNLSAWSEYVSISNSNNETSPNIVSESILCEILNIVFNIKLINANMENKNNPGVDLIDLTSKKAFQVTSNRTQGKIIKTLKQINIDNNRNFSELYFIILGKKGNIEQSKIDSLNLFFPFASKLNIIDLHDLYRIISNLSTIDLEKIDKILDYNITGNIKRTKNKRKKIVISFDERDIEFVGKISKALIDNSFEIYSGSTLLEDTLVGATYKENHHVTKAIHLPGDIETCLIFLSLNYYNSRFRNTKGCAFIQWCNEKKKRLIPLRYDGNVPKITHYNLHRSSSIFCEINQCEKIIETIKHYSELTENRIGEYSFKEILYHYDPNYSLYDNFFDRKDKIGYQIYIKKERARDGAIEGFCITFHIGVNYDKTYGTLIEKHKIINQYVKHQKVIVLLPKESNVSDFDRRKKYINRVTNIDFNKIYSSDEFLWKFCTPERIKEPIKYLSDPDRFVQPYLNEYKIEMETDSNSKLNRIDSEIVVDDFIDNDDLQLLLLIGSGGIGKTTLVKRISDKFLEQRQDASIVFLSSSKLISNLNKINNEVGLIEIYHLYKSQFDFYSDNTDDIMPKDVFDQNIDNGNILFVIDGIDEIISNVYNFDINKILESVLKDNGRLGFAKILMTSRFGSWVDVFLQKNNYLYSIKIYEILAFDKELATSFFTKRGITTKKINGHIGDLEGMVGSSKESSLYPPFILEVVLKYENTISYAQNYPSKLLNVETNKTDRILASICSREIQRQNQNSIDKQIYVLIDIAIKYRGVVSHEQLLSILDKYGISKDKLSAYKVHPLLIESQKSVKFVYDFFLDYFKSIYVYKELFIDSDVEVSDYTIDLLSGEMHNASVVVDELSKRIGIMADTIPIANKIEYLHYCMLEKNRTPVEISKAITSLFITVLNSAAEKNIKSKNTFFLKKMFSKEGSNEINNFYFYKPKVNFLFDFSGLVFKNSTIEGYYQFFDCTFDKDTFFSDSCQISDVSCTRIENLSAKELNFSTKITTDYSFSEIFNKVSLNFDFQYEKGKTILRDFFDIFENHGFFEKREYKTSVTRFNKKKAIKKVEFEDLEDILISNKMIEVLKDGHTYLRISAGYKSDIEKFIQENLITRELDTAIKEIAENLL